jgi:DNA polymerase elongation subunit (family B)
VYFAVPSGWREADERALVADIARALPDGIRLEYEGRYRAMFSHEVKNYAMLTYAGELILRGVALRSSRAEPYGERFLRRAMHCLLTGDVPGVRAAFLQTVAALQHRSLPTADVAARLRLSKTPQAYRISCRTQREAQYEALLAAGRTEWMPGERIRVYRAAHGATVWLPDHDEPSITDQDAASSGADANRRRDYDIAHYVEVLRTSYAGRLRKAFSPDAFAQLFQLDEQPGLFDLPLEEIEPIWIRCAPLSS